MTSRFDEIAFLSREQNEADLSVRMRKAIAAANADRRLTQRARRLLLYLIARIVPENGFTNPSGPNELCEAVQITPRVLQQQLEALNLNGHVLQELAVRSDEPHAWRFAFPHLAEGAEQTARRAPASRSGVVAAESARPTLAAPGLRLLEPSEESIQRAVIDHLRWRGHADTAYFSIPNGGYRRRAEAGRLKVTGVMAGAPDLVLFRQGQAFALELKSVSGRRSVVQSTLHTRLERAGVQVATAYGLDEALQQLIAWQLVR